VVNTMRQLLYLSDSQAKIPLYFGIHKKLVTTRSLHPAVENYTQLRTRKPQFQVSMLY
jgi:hypothetical protein